MSGFNRPLFPTTGATPDEQRSRAGLAEIVRSLLDSGVFLNRLFPGKLPQRLSSLGTGVQVPLAWGGMNRVPPVPVVVAFLPQITPRQIGTPFVISKASASGLVMVQPGGVGVDGRTQPTVDGLATGFQFSEAGQRELMTDGANWFTSSGRGSAFPQGGSARFPIVTVVASMLTLDATHAFKYLRFTTGCLVTVPSGLYAPSTELYLRSTAPGAVILNQTGIGTNMMTGLLRPPASFKTQTAEMGATVGLFAVDNATIDVTGHLERF